MKIEFIIIGVILTVGGILFSSELHGLLPESVEDATITLKNDVTKLSFQTYDSIEEGVEQSADNIGISLDSSINTVESSKDTITKKLSEIKQLDYSLP